MARLNVLGPALAVLGCSALLAPGPARAECTGSGTEWTCTAGSTRDEVQSAIDDADDEAVITFASGGYDWTDGRISLNAIDGVTLICATERTCDVMHDGDLIFKDDVPVASARLHRISGFNFTGSAGTGTIWFLGQNDLTAIRIDHNTFHETNGSECKVAVFFGAIDPALDGNMYGVIDHNTFTAPRNQTGVKHLAGQDAAWQTGLPGSAQNLFIEDNVFMYPEAGYDGGCGCIDSWAGGPTVFRFNQATNCRAVVHGVCHGGPPNFEVYHNTITTPDGYRHVHHQGSGEMFVFDNDLTNGDEIALLHYRSCPSPDTGCGMPRCDGTQSIDANRTPMSTYRGYPCYRQPGRDESGRMRPIFAWGNVNDGGRSVIENQNAWGCSDPSPEDHVRENRDYYNAVSADAQTSPTSPFDGTTGMGFGTMANRPTTCTTTSEAADAGDGGVGYWATDAGAWNRLAGPAEQGILFMCTATNTWTEYYEPYLYPHPLAFSASCNNGAIDAGETCDPPASCPTECADDGDACTRDALSGSPASCDVACNHTPISTCAGGDGCCPSGCTPPEDSDCGGPGRDAGGTPGRDGGTATMDDDDGCGCGLAREADASPVLVPLLAAGVWLRRRSKHR